MGNQERHMGQNKTLFCIICKDEDKETIGNQRHKEMNNSDFHCL